MERTPDTVEFTPRKCIMPKMSSTDATIHDLQYLIHAQESPEPARPLAKLVNQYKD